jgi:hypothetical protein
MRIGRNAPCPCGSGKKYKHCHALKPDEAPVPLRAAASPPPPEPTDAERGGQPKKQRQCGTCHACCGFAFEVNAPELVVAKGEGCPHVVAHGCGQWKGNLPALCKRYMCSYLVEPARLTPDERPDRAGAIVQKKGTKWLLVAESRPDGLSAVLENDYWRAFIQKNVWAGLTLIGVFWEDPLNAELVYAKREGAKIACEMPACSPEGEPLLVPVEPVYGRPLSRATFKHNHGITLGADELIERLGEREAMVIEERAEDGSRVYFRITRRQGALLARLRLLMSAKRRVRKSLVMTV